MRASPQHGGAAPVQHHVLVRVRELLRREGVHVRDEHAATAHAIHGQSVQYLPAGLGGTPSTRVLAVLVREDGIARVAANGKHFFTTVPRRSFS